MLIEVKVKVSRIIDGKTKKLTETYLIDKMFFSEAEFEVTSLLTREKEQAHSIESFEIQSLRISSIIEVFTQYAGQFSFVVTMKTVFLEDDGNEKITKYKLLLWANDLTEANVRALEIHREGYDLEVEGIHQQDITYLESKTN